MSRMVGDALEKSFARHKVIKSVHLELQGGQTHALMGKNGAGKTTLLRIFAGLLQPDDGKVGYENDKGIVDARPHLGVVLHSSMLYPDLTVFENLRFFAEIYQVANVAERVEMVLQQVELQDRRNQGVRTLSRGMTQRLAIARSLLHQPEVLLLDEPFSGLDESSCQKVETLLQDFCKNNGAVLFVAHDFELVARLANEVSLLVDGRIASTFLLDGMTGEELRSRYREICGGRDV